MLTTILLSDIVRKSGIKEKKMRLQNFSVDFEMGLTGETGHQNCSKLTVGDFTFANSGWDKGETDCIVSGAKFQLWIPSGCLRGTVKVVTKSENAIDVRIDPCEWEGKLAGLLGGMCGYGSFTTQETSAALVKESRMIPDSIGSLEWTEFNKLRGALWAARQLGVEFRCLEYRSLTLDEFMFLHSLSGMEPVLRHRDKVMENLAEEEYILSAFSLEHDQEKNSLEFEE